MKHAWVFVFVCLLVTGTIGAGSSQEPQKTGISSAAGQAKFEEITSRLGINFQYQSSHTSRKYLLETMGAGVALFDYDNDGRLDIFLVTGAPLEEPAPTGTLHQKAGPAYRNRL